MPVVEEGQVHGLARRQASSEELLLGGSEDLFIGGRLKRELVSALTHENSAPGTPVLFGT
jgi:hypothetical protein